ncbi:MAG: hypothetical protein KAS90_01025 [Candidatus Aenigmarchaeota archaeon]|nr:hypothetical protein [Candidatus Aenigmarchaeota archaeon]
MQSFRNPKKGSLPIETVVIIVLFVAVLAILIIIIANITGKGTDDMGQSIDASGDGALCQIECIKCCSGAVPGSEDCNAFVTGGCCIDNKDTEFGC